MKILTYIPVWQRRHITRLCFDGLLRAYKQAPQGFEFITVIVASDDDDAALAEEYGFDVCRHENQPLGDKFNAGVGYALDKYRFDYLFQLNSDDLLSTDCWDLFAQHVRQGRHFFGVDRIYIYDSESRNIKFFQYALGCGIRFIRADLLMNAGIVNKTRETAARIAARSGMFVHMHDDGGAERFELWTPGIGSGLDTDSEIKIIRRTQVEGGFGGYAQLLVRNKVKQLPVVVDIKSQVNIHLFPEFRNAKTVEEADRPRVLRRFPELMTLEKKINTHA